MRNVILGLDISLDGYTACKVLLTVLLYALAITGRAQSGHEILWTWTNTATSQGWPLCAGSVTNHCSLYYELENVTDSDTPFVISQSIDPSATSFLQTADVMFGYQTYALSLIYRDNNGVQQVTPPAMYTLYISAPLGPNHLNPIHRLPPPMPRRVITSLYDPFQMP